MAIDPAKISMSGSEPARWRSVLTYLREQDLIRGVVPIGSASASDDATIDFTSGINGTYNTYLFVGSGVVPATDGVVPHFRLSVASAFKSGASDYSWARHNYIGSGAFDNADSALDIGTSFGSAAGENVSFKLWLDAPSSTALYAPVQIECYGTDTNGNANGSALTGLYRGGVEAIDGIRFFFSSGNVESGEFTLYGLPSA